MFIKKTAQLFDLSPAKQLSSREILISRWTLVLLTCLKAVSFEKKPSTKTKFWISKTKPSQRSHEALRVQASSLCKNSNSVISSHISTPRVWRLASCKDEIHMTEKYLRHLHGERPKRSRINSWLWNACGVSICFSRASRASRVPEEGGTFHSDEVWCGFQQKFGNASQQKTGFCDFVLNQKNHPQEKDDKTSLGLVNFPFHSVKEVYVSQIFRETPWNNSFFGNYTPIPSICIHN